MIKYGVFWICADCGEPVGTLEMCEEVGYNFGIDGHFKSDREAAEKEFALLAKQVETLVGLVDRLNTAIVGNVGSDRPGIISDISAIKSHIGFNQPRTMHERMTSIEEFVIEYRKEHEEQKSDLRKVLLPIFDRLLTFVLGALAYIIIVNVVK